MRASDGRSVMDLIAEVQAIDPGDPRAGVMQSELIQTRRARAEQHAADLDWDAARAELAALEGLPLSAEQNDAVTLDLQRINSAEQRAVEQADAAARLAEAQRRAGNERLEQERLSQLAAAREARIADTAAALEASLSGFDANNPVASMREVLERINELEALQPQHALLAQAGTRLDSAVEQAVRRQPTTAAGLTLIETAEDLLGSKPALAQLKSSLQSRLLAEQAAERRAAVETAEARLREALQSEIALADDSPRESARRALAELAAVLEDDPGRLASARQRYVDAHLAAAEALVADKRFSVAERVLDAAATQADSGPTSPVVAARNSLAAARQASRQERARQETQARIEALAQRFSLEVNSGQITRARQTLADYRQLDPDSSLAGDEGDQRLAAGYLRIARQRLDAGNLEGARQLVAGGLEVVPGHDALERLGVEADRLSLLSQISGWFSGKLTQSAANMRALTERYRQMNPDDYANQEVAWAASAAHYLATLTDDPGAYNQFLEDARSVLVDHGALADLAAIVPIEPESQRERVVEQTHVPDDPAVPALSFNDLLGRWCAQNIEIEFERSRMVFILDSGRADYRISGYDVADDTIHVNWDDRQLGPMVFEFGQFTEAKDEMVQLRGRPAGNNNWQTYNRNFLRCG
jgi:hypothetical protein